ncbi:MAG: hypothetical protein CVT49_13520 [candidate division Zixibacteria bacterium HGW-Zixibacteria-1]|nr:MAG: hypothetical protein CVT49_13520 [candidate division Zixibacteria bacterium HGW-Zixibacteria-1]
MEKSDFINDNFDGQMWTSIGCENNGVETALRLSLVIVLRVCDRVMAYSNFLENQMQMEE